MAFDSHGDLFVATGDQGEIHRVTPDGKGKVFFKTDEAHVRSMALDAALEWIDEEELVELTPKSVRMRTRMLQTALRSKHRAAWTDNVQLQVAEGN
jgi:predicted membrane GTPase involved in stress response